MIKLHGIQYFNLIGIKNSFQQVELKEESKKYVSFKFLGKIFFNRVPFGTKVSSAALIKYLSKVLVYVDDILIICKD